ncbi:MAG TPA: DUF4157 domain-containing protein [Xanthobacteraceae bacterium]|jgi:uncharacterized protein DUF4157|nr:DUF4157 domain-containing protein [Xanthobacteraceae bacterium]
MSEALLQYVQRKSGPDAAPSFTPIRGHMLQRKCACGGTPGPSGECAECAKKKSGLQRKLTIGASNDPLEQEADRIAGQVLAAPAHPAISGAPPHIHRFSGQWTGQMDAAPASVDQALASPGRPLEPTLREDMEQRFGHDFSQVRVHFDAAAEQSARDVNAHAYTAGRDMVFGAGRFAPRTHEGRRLIAHELTHVVQQGNEVSTKIIQGSWDWQRAGAGALIGGVGGAVVGGLVGGPVGALVGAGIGAVAGGLIGGLTGEAQPSSCPGGLKTVTVDFVRLHGSTLSPATELAAANTIYSSCCLKFITGAMPPQESLATTQSWLGGDTDVNASGITCSATTTEEKKMYDTATVAHALSGRMRVFLVNTFSGYGAAGFSRPPYCAGGGYANHVILSNSASSATNPLAHEFGHILLNSGTHSTSPNLMAPSGGTVLNPTQCATCFSNA